MQAVEVPQALRPDVGEALIHEVPGHYCAPRGRAVEALHRALAACDIDPDHCRAWIHVDNDDPVRALVAHSRGAELLVLGRSDRGRSRRSGAPSVSESCLQQAPCPVVVVDDASHAAVLQSA